MSPTSGSVFAIRAKSNESTSVAPRAPRCSRLSAAIWRGVTCAMEIKARWTRWAGGTPSTPRCAVGRLDGRALDRPMLDRAFHALRRHHVVQGVIERPQIRIDFRLHVARQEAKILPSLDRRAGEDDSPDSFLGQRVDGSGHGEVRLAGSR